MVNKKELRKDAQKAKNEIALQCKKVMDGGAVELYIIEDCLERIEKYIGKGAATSNYLITNSL